MLEEAVEILSTPSCHKRNKDKMKGDTTQSSISLAMSFIQLTLDGLNPNNINIRFGFKMFTYVFHKRHLLI